MKRPITEINIQNKDGKLKKKNENKRYEGIREIDKIESTKTIVVGLRSIR